MKTKLEIQQRPNVVRELQVLWRALRRSRASVRIFWISAAIVFVIIANAVGQIRLNRWRGDFYDALEERNIDAFLDQTLTFLAVVAVLLALGVSQTWLDAVLKLRLRDWLSANLLDLWLDPGRAYRLRLAGEIGRNPDQRIHEDARKLTDLTVALGLGLIQSTLLLASFVGVLWVLSANVVFELRGQTFTVPGYMVWCALGYSLAGSVLAWVVGRPLVRINEILYGREAELRYGMVRVSDAAEGIAVYRGEADEREALGHKLAAVIESMTRRASGLAALAWVTGGYGWLALIVPILVAAPGYFTGDLSFGTLMMVVGAFNQVQQALRWFVDNFATIADWRATLLRVMAIRDALEDIGAVVPGEAQRPRIRVTRNSLPRLELVGFSVALHNGSARLACGDLSLEQGERLLVRGGPDTGKTMMFRALAGIWPWGTGEIRLPPAEDILFLPNRPYLPPGTLLRTISYPAQPAPLDDDAASAALDRVGLGHIADELDRDTNWESELTLDEQQRLAFARALIRRPAWLFLDDAASAMGGPQRRMMIEALTEASPEISIIAFRRDEDTEDAVLFSRQVRIIRETTNV